MSDHVAFAQSRHHLIRDMLKTQGRVFCTKLAEILQVSEHTIRRDLQDLAKEGLCRRVHGGAISLLPATADFVARLDQADTAKEQLGLASAGLLKAGSIVFIDAGTTNLAVVQALPDDLALTIVTNTPTIAAEVMTRPSIELIMIGGTINANSGSALGLTALKQIHGMHFDQCLLGMCALDAEAGATAFEYEDAQFKQVIVSQSTQVIVALTADKTPAVARHFVADCEAITDLVVASSIPADKIAPFNALGINIHTAPAC